MGFLCAVRRRGVSDGAQSLSANLWWAADLLATFERVTGSRKVAGRFRLPSYDICDDED